MRMNEKIENVCLADAYIEENILYAAGYEWNILFEFDMKSLTLRRLGEFSGFKFLNSFQIHSIFKFEESIFVFSKNSYEVAEYSLTHNHFKYYYPKQNIGKQELICSVCRVKDEVWIFQKAVITHIVAFSMKKREYMEYEINIEGKIENYIPFSFESSIYIDSQIWRCIPGSSDLLIYDIKNMKMQVWKTNLPMQFQTMNYDKGYIYILTFDGKHIVSINILTYEVTVFATGYIGIREFPFVNIEKIDDYFLFIPCFEQKIFLYRMEKGILCLMQCLKLPNEFKKIRDIKDRTLFWKWIKKDYGLYLLPFAGNGMLYLDLNTCKITYYPIKISEGDYLGWLLHFYPLQSESNLNLKKYLTGVIHNLQTKIGETRRKTIGQGNIIWENVKQ